MGPNQAWRASIKWGSRSQTSKVPVGCPTGTFNICSFGGAEGIRTPDFLLAKEALSRAELQPHS
jgi:hypothetical protein